MSNIGRVHYREVSSKAQCELGPKNDVHYRGVSAIKFTLQHGKIISSWLQRGFIVSVSLSFHPFLRKASVVEMCPL